MHIGLILCWIFYCVGVPAAVQVESLQSYAFLCSLQQNRWQTELLAGFPSLLVPLAGDDQVRVFAGFTYWLCIFSCYLLAAYIWLLTNGFLFFYCLCHLIICWMFSWFLRKYGLLKWYICIFWNSLQSVRDASMKCTDALRTLWCRIESSGEKNGTSLSE